MMNKASANVAGFIGIGAIGYGLATWIAPGCGLAVVGVLLVLLAIRSSTE
jgi:hypothetical protein